MSLMTTGMAMKFDKGLTPFEECLSVLGTWRLVVLECEQRKIMYEFSERFPIAWWGRIDWARMDKKYSVATPADITVALKQSNRSGNEPIYILWSHGEDPIIETTLEEALYHREDIEPISPDQWLYCPSEGWVVEFYHDDEKVFLGVL